MTDKKCQNLEAVRYDQSARDMRQLNSKVMQFLSRQAFPLRGMTESELVTKTSGGRALNSCTTSELSADAFLLAFHRFEGDCHPCYQTTQQHSSLCKDIAQIARAKEVVNYMANNGVNLLWRRAHGGAVGEFHGSNHEVHIKE